MRKIFSCSFLVLLSAVGVQAQSSIEKKIDLDRLQNLIKSNNSGVFKPENLGAKKITSSNGFDVYSLPIDKMPCLVPNKQNLTANIPNAYRKGNVTAVPIPNAFPSVVKKLPE